MWEQIESGAVRNMILRVHKALHGTASRKSRIEFLGDLPYTKY